MRLRDLFTGGLTHRELISYITHMPRDSALARAMLGDAVVDYTPEVAHLAGIGYRLDVANWQRTQKKGGAPKPPKAPIPRRETD